MDWIDGTLFARWGAPVLALFIGAFLNRRLEKRPRVVTYLLHASSVRLQPTEQYPNPLVVHTHSIVIRNDGKAPANNVRFGHNILPEFSVYPATKFEVEKREGGAFEIVFPKLVSNEQITVTYLYYPPTFWHQVNTYLKSDEGLGQFQHVLPTRQYSKKTQAFLTGLMAIGAITSLYFCWQVVVYFWTLKLSPQIHV